MTAAVPRALRASEARTLLHGRFLNLKLFSNMAVAMPVTRPADIHAVLAGGGSLREFSQPWTNSKTARMRNLSARLSARTTYASLLLLLPSVRCCYYGPARLFFFLFRGPQAAFGDSVRGVATGALVCALRTFLALCNDLTLPGRNKRSVSAAAMENIM